MNSIFLNLFRYIVIFFSGMAFDQNKFLLFFICVFIAVFAHKVFEDEKDV
tara:strand:- start:12855 stop:13004 length:150 start_codon:yes stop_codon:yes gene_type:complete